MSGELHYLETVALAGTEDVRDVVVSADGLYVYVLHHDATENTTYVSSYSRDAEGLLTFKSQIEVTAAWESMTICPAVVGTPFVLVDTVYLYGGSAGFQYLRSSVGREGEGEVGDLLEWGSNFTGEGDPTFSGLAVSTDGQSIYACIEATNKLWNLVRNSDGSPSLEGIFEVPQPVELSTGPKPVAVVCSPDGLNVYVACKGSGGEVWQFKRIKRARVGIERVQSSVIEAETDARPLVGTPVTARWTLQFLDNEGNVLGAGTFEAKFTRESNPEPPHTTLLCASGAAYAVGTSKTTPEVTMEVKELTAFPAGTARIDSTQTSGPLIFPVLEFTGVAGQGELEKVDLLSEAGGWSSFKGVWAEGTTYHPGDGVRESGVPYVCIAETTGNKPSTDGEVHWVPAKGPPLHHLACSPDNKSLYVTSEDAANGKLYEYIRGVNGKLSGGEATTTLGGPLTGAVIATNANAYAGGATLGTSQAIVEQFSRNESTGKLAALAPASVNSGTPSGESGNVTLGIAMHGSNLYTAAPKSKELQVWANVPIGEALEDVGMLV